MTSSVGDRELVRDVTKMMTVNARSKVVVLGSTGFIGSHVLTASLMAGIPATGAARRPGGRPAA